MTAASPVRSELIDRCREVWPGVHHLLYPPVCHFYGAALAEASDFCNACRKDLLADPHPYCPRCGTTIGPYSLSLDGCSSCRDQSFRFESVTRLGPYTGRLREAILRMKLANGEEL